MCFNRPQPAPPPPPPPLPPATVAPPPPVAPSAPPQMPGKDDSRPGVTTKKSKRARLGLTNTGTGQFRVGVNTGANPSGGINL